MNNDVFALVRKLELGYVKITKCDSSVYEHLISVVLMKWRLRGKRAAALVVLKRIGDKFLLQTLHIFYIGRTYFSTSCKTAGACFEKKYHHGGNTAL